MNPPDNQVLNQETRIRKKPLLCSVIQFSALTYFLIMALFFLSGVVFSGKIIEIISPYYSVGDPIPENFLWISLSVSILYFTAGTGILFFINNRKYGFFIFFAASLVIFSLDLTLLIFDWLRYLIHSGFIFILGIAHFSKKCYF